MAPVSITRRNWHANRRWKIFSCFLIGCSAAGKSCSAIGASKVNKHEAKRWAHKLAADALRETIHEIATTSKSADAPKILKALGHIQETHARLGPRSGDSAPCEPEYKGESFAFDDPAPDDPANEDPNDPGDHICRCNERLPHAPRAIGPNGEKCIHSDTTLPADVADTLAVEGPRAFTDEERDRYGI